MVESSTDTGNCSLRYLPKAFLLSTGGSKQTGTTNWPVYRPCEVSHPVLLLDSVDEAPNANHWSHHITGPLHMLYVTYAMECPRKFLLGPPFSQHSREDTSTEASSTGDKCLLYAAHKFASIATNYLPLCHSPRSYFIYIYIYIKVSPGARRENSPRGDGRADWSTREGFRKKPFKSSRAFHRRACVLPTV